MPFMVIDGHDIKIDNNTLDAMNQFIQDDIQTSSEEEPRRQSRSRDDGTYDITTLDPHYLKKYYLNKLKTPFTVQTVGQPYQTIQIYQHTGTPKSAETFKTFVETLTSNLTPSPPTLNQ